VTEDVQPKAGSGPKPRISRRRRWAFRAVVLCLSFLPLAVGEAVCRWKGYGGYPPIFRHLGTVDGRRYFGTDQRGLSTFFHQNLTTPGRMDEQVFTLPKDRRTVRIAWLGGSAALGYPYPPSLAASSFVRAMLSDFWPDRNVEVLNAGTTAVASFPVMYILEELLAFDLDMVVVYSGNNEFYGAHGVASVHSFGRSTRRMRLMRFLRRSALVQWASDRATRRKPSAWDGERPRVLMECVMADAQIGPDDPRRAAAAQNLRNHLTEMVRLCRNRGVPVLLCTLPANESGLAPIGDDVTLPLAPADRAAFDSWLKQGREAANPDDAVERLERAVVLYGRHAESHFRLGCAYAALGRPDEAKAAYIAARDLDTMPWRAPSALSDAVRDVAGQGGILCDIEEAFRAASPDGVIGWELMEDHVHPSLRGQALIAVTVLECMQSLSGPLQVDGKRVRALPEWEVYAARLGDNEFDRYGVASRMVSLLEAPFYRKHNAAALSRFQALCVEHEARMTPVELAAARAWKDPRVHQGGHRPITGMVGMALLDAGEYEKADRLLTLARRNVPRYSVWNWEFTWGALHCRREMRSTPLPEDRILMEEMLRDSATFIRVTGLIPPPLRRHLGLVFHMISRHEDAIAHLSEAVQYVNDSSGFIVVESLAESLIAVGQKERARRLLQTPVRDPELRAQCEALLARLESGVGGGG